MAKWVHDQVRPKPGRSQQAERPQVFESGTTQVPNIAFPNEVEPFVDGNAAARFLGVTRRRILDLARSGGIPAHPIGNGQRRTWRFRLSEIGQAVATEKPDTLPAKHDMISAGSPRQPNRRN